jgi:succinate-semialdehyde dehydrogenase/glutarate-semialdehyde dehydrogenase
VDIGPLIDDRQRKIVEELVQDAVQKGAKLLCGGEPLAAPKQAGLTPRTAGTSSETGPSPSTTRSPTTGGYFFAPTVLDEVPSDARILREEVFGPVAPVSTFSTEEQAIEAANATEYGLVAYIYTRDLARTLRVSEAIEAGMVGVNQGIVSNPAAPFGGVKQSGFGREGGFEGIGEYLETKYVALNV